MKQYRYIILGAGPAGLTFANILQRKGITDFLVLEAESEAGGLCRSMEVDGTPLDIGGGHFLDVRRPKVNEFLFSFMPESEWDMYTRNSKINLEGNLIDHPIEANIWQMDIEKQVSYLKSIAEAGCVQGIPMPEKFVDWIYWKLGRRVSEDYMIPYNSKIFASDLDSLGTYWLDKLPDVSFENTLRSCLMHHAYGEQPGHAQFYYPKKYGYGELWLRMADAVKSHMVYESAVAELAVTEDGSKKVSCVDGSAYLARTVITTIPWISLEKIGGMPEELWLESRKLRHSSVWIEYVPEHLDTDAHWIYYPEEKLDYHRILVRHNFCPNSKGYWTETNSSRYHEKKDSFAYLNTYAYPLNTIEKPRIMEKLSVWARRQQIYPLGRWGEHMHYNSDVTVQKAMELAGQLERD